MFHREKDGERKGTTGRGREERVAVTLLPVSALMLMLMLMLMSMLMGVDVVWHKPRSTFANGLADRARTPFSFVIDYQRFNAISISRLIATGSPLSRLAVAFTRARKIFTDDSLAARYERRTINSAKNA